MTVLSLSSRRLFTAPLFYEENKPTKSRLVESHSGARETIIARSYHNLIPYTPRSKKHGEGCPLTIRLWVWGSVLSSSSGIWGGAPADNGFYAYFRSERT